jgi:hypothetical protein
MRTRVALVFLAVACGLAPARGAAAQLPFAVSVDVSAGVFVGSGGTYVDRSGSAIEALVAYRLRPTSAGILLAAVTLGVQAPMTTDDRCTPLPNGDCMPGFPLFVSGGALLGVQRGSARTASARFMAGPVYYRAEDDGGALGVQGLVEVATPSWHHTALFASLRHSLIPRFRQDAVGITSFGLGIRIQ